MADAQPKEKNSHVIPMTVNDLIYMQLQDFKTEFRDSRKELDKRIDNLDKRIDKLDDRIDKLDAKIDDTRKELNARMDKIESKIDSAMNQGQICLITTIGILITVLYAMFFK